MITVTTTRARVSHNDYVEQKKYEIFGFTFFKSINNTVVNTEQYITLEGIVNKIRLRQEEVKVKAEKKSEELQNH